MGDARERRAGPVTVFGFGIAVAMWGLGYFGRLPGVTLPTPPLLAALCLVPAVGGALLRRLPGARALDALLAGLVAGLVNLLVLGSFVRDASGPGVPSPAVWMPLAILLTGALAALGALVGARLPSAAPVRSWTAALVHVAIAATLLLLAAGGIVTTKEAGLAVVDWPNSFRSNMFLYPFSKMSGPIYLEHAHRLLGALVGLTTLVLAIFVARVEPRRWVRGVAWGALLLVIVQGVLGGLRVTGYLTLSDDPSRTAPNLTLAAVHGVTAQIFLSLLIALAAFTSSAWRTGRAAVARAADRRLCAALVAVVVLQLVLGAVQRHFGALLIPHVIWGVAVVAPLAVHTGMRHWGKREPGSLIGRIGLVLVGTVPLQLMLGLAAWVVTYSASGSGAELLFATAHQWFGAVVLGSSVLLLCWNWREPVADARVRRA